MRAWPVAGDLIIDHFERTGGFACLPVIESCSVEKRLPFFAPNGQHSYQEQQQLQRCFHSWFSWHLQQFSKQLQPATQREVLGMAYGVPFDTNMLPKRYCLLLAGRSRLSSIPKPG